jgi:hypothetical protein
MEQAMSTAITAHISGYTAYTVEHRGNCILITGPVRASAFIAFTKLAPEGSVACADTARVLGVTFAIGPKDELDQLRATQAPHAEKEARAKNPSVSDAAAKWLASGHRGVSSNAIFSHLTGIDATGSSGFDTPYEPADFRRCRLLLEQAPELAPRIQEMKSVSPAWACLVDQWDTICATMDEECPEWRTERGVAQRTYQLIKQAIGR